MSGVEGAEREDYDERKAGVEFFRSGAKTLTITSKYHDVRMGHPATPEMPTRFHRAIDPERLALDQEFAGHRR
jgi:hypothetical protein